VAVSAFVDKAREVGEGIVAVSTLMSTTMPGMGRLVEALKRAGLRDGFKVMIGGGPLSAAFAEKIGADAYGANAMEAVRLATEWERVTT
jgi:methanogenic corrinoid protein MtbC1